MFWAIFIMDFCSLFPVIFLSQIWKTVGLQHQIDDYTLTTIGSLGSVANGLSRMLTGPVQDKTSFVFLYKVVLAIELLVCFSLYWAVSVSPWLYMIIVFLGFACLGAHFVLYPNMLLKVFGMRSGSQLYSILYAAISLSTLSGFFVYKLANRLAGAEGSQTVFHVAIGLILISIGILYNVIEEKQITKKASAGNELGLLNSES